MHRELASDDLDDPQQGVRGPQPDVVPPRPGAGASAVIWICPPLVVIVVVSSSVSRSQRCSPSKVSVGLMRQWPPSSCSNAANTDGESKRGRHHQSAEPCFDTSAALWQSDRKR